MTALTSACADAVEAQNDAFALAHDIDDYYENSSFLIRYVEHRRLRCIARMLAAQSYERILEIGCGGGHVLRMFPQCELTGVDVSGRMLEKAERNLAGLRARLLKGQTQTLDLPNGGFDGIVCSEVLEHTDDPHAVLREVRRLLAPGGRAVITFPNDLLIRRIKEAIRGARLDRLPFVGRIGWGGDDFHLHVWSVSQMRTLLSEYFRIRRERFAPNLGVPIRCCFLCTR